MALKGGAPGDPVADFDFFRWSGVQQGEAPSVTAAAEPTSGTAPLDVEFSAEGTDPEGGALTYAWDFGVGGTQDDTADTADASWTYTEPGTYTATVTVTDPEGQTGEDTVEVVVEEPAEGRTWVVDAVDSATDNQWVSADNGTSTVTIEVGDTVEWQFDQATMGHDLTSLDSARHVGPAAAGVPRTRRRPGALHLHRARHLRVLVQHPRRHHARHRGRRGARGGQPAADGDSRSSRRAPDPRRSTSTSRRAPATPTVTPSPTCGTSARATGRPTSRRRRTPT